MSPQALRRFEIQTYTLCDGWTNTWLVSEGDSDPVPEVFSSRQAAQAELDDFLAEIKEEISYGERNPEDGYDASEFRIVEIDGEGGAS